jgi:hypothetical protein
MKKLFTLFLFACLTSLASKAMDPHLPKLQEIVSPHFKLTAYDPLRDFNDWHAFFEKAPNIAALEAAPPAFSMADPYRLILTNIQDPNGFMLLGLTCRFFNTTTRHPGFHFGAYCESVDLDTIPYQILNNKVFRFNPTIAMHGILRMASSYGTPKEKLLRCLDPARVKAYITSRIPTFTAHFSNPAATLKQLDEIVPGKLYPLFKVLDAVYPYKEYLDAADGALNTDSSVTEMPPIFRTMYDSMRQVLFQADQRSSLSELSFYSLDLLLNPHIHACVRDATAELHGNTPRWFLRLGMFNILSENVAPPIPMHHPAALLGQQLFRHQRFVPYINHVLFVPNPAKHTVAAQVLNWVMDVQPPLFNMRNDLEIILKGAIHLQKPDLVQKMVLALIRDGLPEVINAQPFSAVLLNALLHLTSVSDEVTQNKTLQLITSDVRNFCENIVTNYLGVLNNPKSMPTMLNLLRVMKISKFDDLYSTALGGVVSMTTEDLMKIRPEHFIGLHKMLYENNNRQELIDLFDRLYRQVSSD